MKPFYKLLFATMTVLCLVSIAEAQKIISTDQKSTFLGPKSLTFRAFDNNLNGTDSDYLILTNTVYIHYGTKFSLTNANFTVRNSGNVWLPNQGNELATVEFEYLGLDPIPPGSNLCIFIGPEGVIDVIEIYLDGHSDPNIFGISGSSAASINLPTTETSTLYITQGTWAESELGEFTLGGNVVDGLGIGISDSQWQAQGAPGELDPHGGGLGTGGNGPGDYWGVLQCNGEIYICDYLSLQPYVENWVLSQTGDLGDPHNDPSELCDELCDLLCTDCDFSVQIEIQVQRDPFHDCTAVAAAVSCDPPFNYEWQKKINGEWISLIFATSEDGTIADFTDIYRNEEYRLVVRCSDYCTKISNVVSFHGCPDEPCLSNISGYQNYCHLSVTVTDCTTATYQWYALLDGSYLPIPSANTAHYTASQAGEYIVLVSGCDGCEELVWNFNIEPTNIKTFVEDVDLCSYAVCVLTTADSILNITVVVEDTIDLNNESNFSFNYPNTILGLEVMTNDINFWLDSKGYYGDAYVAGESPKCKNGLLLIIEDTDVIFEDIIYSIPTTNSDAQIVTAEWEEFDCKTEVIGFKLLAISDCENYTAISWSTGETGEFIIVDAPGTYSASVNCGNGCIMTESITIINDPSSQSLAISEHHVPNFYELQKPKVEDVDIRASGIKVYPNPGRGLYTVEVESGNHESISLSLFSTTGILMKSFGPIVAQNGKVKASIDIQDLQAGIYLLKANELRTENVSKVILIK